MYSRFCCWWGGREDVDAGVVEEAAPPLGGPPPDDRGPRAEGCWEAAPAAPEEEEAPVEWAPEPRGAAEPAEAR